MENPTLPLAWFTLETALRLDAAGFTRIPLGGFQLMNAIPLAKTIPSLTVQWVKKGIRLYRQYLIGHERAGQQTCRHSQETICGSPEEKALLKASSKFPSLISLFSSIVGSKVSSTCSTESACFKKSRFKKSILTRDSTDQFVNSYNSDKAIFYQCKILYPHLRRQASFALASFAVLQKVGTGCFHKLDQLSRAILQVLIEDFEKTWGAAHYFL